MIHRKILISTLEAQNVKLKAVVYWEEYWNERILPTWSHHFGIKNIKTFLLYNSSNVSNVSSIDTIWIPMGLVDAINSVTI